MSRGVDVVWQLNSEEAYKYKTIFETLYDLKPIRKDRNERDFVVNSMKMMASDHIEDIKSPIWVGYKLTNICNLDCVHCWAVNSGYMPSYDEVTTAVDKMAESDVNFLGLSGGEIFTRADIFDLLQYCKQKRMRLELFTNAILLNEEKICRLNGILDKDCDIFQISLDGVSESIYGKQRKANKLDAVISNILHLKKSGYRIRISYVATHLNVAELYDTYRYVSDLGVEGFSVSPVYPKNKGTLIHSLLDMDVYYDQIYKCINNKTDTEFTFFAQIDFFEKIDKYISQINISKKRENMYFIDTGLLSLYIDANGDVYPEFQLDYMEFKLGNIYKDSLNSIMLNSKDGVKLNRYRTFTDSKCIECKYKELCLSHSYEQAYSAYKNFNRMNPNCKLTSGS